MSHSFNSLMTLLPGLHLGFGYGSACQALWLRSTQTQIQHTVILLHIIFVMKLILSSISCLTALHCLMKFEWQVIRQNFPSNLFPVNTFPMKATINSSKFCSSNFLTCLIHQISSDFSTVKVLHYTVLASN